MKIPKKFKLFGATINVVFDSKRMNDLESYGYAEYGKSLITLAEPNGFEELSEDKIIDTFYHEKVHIILDSMGEHKMSKNERFVDLFSKLLRQSDETSEY